MDRVILHCDLNNFYASVECLYNPEIREKPVAVGGSELERHGIILAKNNIAKKFNIKTGEPIWQAKKKCPELIIVRPNYNRYQKFSKMAKGIYKNYTELIESFGIDECWLDVTQSVKLYGSGEKIANEIREKVKQQLGITISVGVSYNKIFAKLGSDMKKPDAVTVISEENFKDKVWKLPVGDLLYVGASTKRRLNKVGIYTIGDLANTSVMFIKNYLGKWGETLWSFSNGYDHAPILKSEYQATIKGVSNSYTTAKDLITNDQVKMLFYMLSENIGERLRSHNLKGKTIQVSIKDTDLIYIERQGKLSSPSYINSEIAEKAYEIFIKTWDWSKNVRALGIRVTDLNMDEKYTQMTLFNNVKKDKREIIDNCIDKIRGRFGHYSVQRALMLNDNKLKVDSVEERFINPFLRGVDIE